MNRTISPGDLKQLLFRKEDVVIVDVRRKGDYQADGQMIPGATWLDPDKVEQWSTTLPLDREIVIYCVRGGSVSNSVVDQLQARGLQARFIEGGFEGWKSKHGETVGK